MRGEHRDKFVVDLNGEWRFYWNKPESIASLKDCLSDGYFTIPGYWKGLTRHDKKQPDTGYATFALTVYVPQKYIGSFLALQIPEQNAAYTVWVDGKKVSSSGRAGTIRETTVSRAIMHIVSFSPSSHRIEIVIGNEESL